MDCIAQVKQPLSDLRMALSRAEETFQTALYFVLLKEHYNLTMDKIPVGLKGFKHRRDIVFSHAVSCSNTHAEQVAWCLEYAQQERQKAALRTYTCYAIPAQVVVVHIYFLMLCGRVIVWVCALCFVIVM